MATDPTKTLVLRRKAAREVARRFARVRKEVRDIILKGKLITNIVSPGQYQFVRDIDKVPAFERHIQKIIDKEILDIKNGVIPAPQDYWLNSYVGNAYERGAKKARVLAERNLKNITKLPKYSPLTNPAHLERAQLLYTRVFNDMKGVTDVMRGQMSSILSEGVLRGQNPKDVAKLMAERVDKIGITRAKLIARTEIIEGHNQASIKEAEILELETGVKMKVQWVTSLDGRERPTHRARHKKIYTREKAVELIGEPNCRCSVSAYINPEKL